MKRIRFIGFLLFMIIGSATANAQGDTLVKPVQSSVKLGMFYTSHLNYYGRTDSLRSSGIFPLLEVWFNRNFYVNASPVFINNAVSPLAYAGTVATIGYRFTEKNNLGGHVYFVKPFLKDNSQLVQSALKGQMAASITHTGVILNFTGGADIKFSDKTDYGANAGIDHIQRFSLGNGCVLVIDPSIYIYAGTQQFTRSYLKKNNFLIFPGVEEAISEPVNAFNILSYEVSAL